MQSFWGKSIMQIYLLRVYNCFLQYIFSNCQSKYINLIILLFSIIIQYSARKDARNVQVYFHAVND